MAKLNQLIMLENMMRTYDQMNIKDADFTIFQGMCTEKLVDEIIEKLTKMVVSKTRLSSRNVLLANYETMTKTTYWLECKLFSDLPRAESRVLREKVEQMVELLNELMLKSKCSRVTNRSTFIDFFPSDNIRRDIHKMFRHFFELVKLKY